MGKVTGFLEIDRIESDYESINKRIKHYKEFNKKLTKKDISLQGGRCMDCGIPYCHTGCPINNIIPDWNDMVYRDEWKEAIKVLHSTNNFPEFTGRICPAPCEAACTLNIEDKPVTIKSIESAIVDYAWKQKWIVSQKPKKLIGKSVAIVGSGPAGLSAAQQLTRVGYKVTIYEKNQKLGGLLRYGIPDFKMEKYIIDRRVKQMQEEGTIIRNNIHVGLDIDFGVIRNKYDAVLLCSGAEEPRNLLIPGRDLKGVVFAMDFLPDQNRRVSGEKEKNPETFSAKGRKVVVIGGGDTGSDCIGTSFRQGAKSVVQLEIMPKPPIEENKLITWPNWPLKYRTSSSQAEGANRDFSVSTKNFYGENGTVKGLNCIRVNEDFKFIKDTDFRIEADLVLLAMGFLGPIKEQYMKKSQLKFDSRGNVLANDEHYHTSLEGVFAAGDMRRGQSLVVWAIREGRQAAHAIDKWLTGKSDLPK